jgi:hypothetical protein
MQQAADQTQWRRNFLSALALLAQAGARLPFGVPDPVLSGGSAVELYTGGLWSAADLEVVASDARKLAVELFAVGFRWSERPRYAGRGLWHPELQIGMNIIEPRAAPSVAEQANRLVVVLDLERSGPTDGVSLKVVGIEDLIVQQAGCWLRDGAPSGELAALLQALVGLGRAGVGGPLDARYLQRRLARETDGEVVVEILRSEESRAEIWAPRTICLTRMQARIGAWCDRHGLSSDPLLSSDPSGFGGTPTCFVRDRNGVPERGGGSSLPSAKIVPFDTTLPPSWMRTKIHAIPEEGPR